MTDSRIIPVPAKQLEQRYGTIARDVRRLKATAIDSEHAMSYKGDILFGYDWDNYTNMGVYRVGLSTWSSTTNGPSLAYSYGTLVVAEAGLSVTQVYYPHNMGNGGIWTRTKWNAADWTVWNGIHTQTVLAPQAPTWTLRRQTVAQTFTQTRAEFQRFGQAVIGSGRVDITDTVTGVNEVDVTFTGIGTPAYTRPCGVGFYWDSNITTLYPVTVWVETSGRFFFIRSDATTNGTNHLGNDPAPATDMNGDWLDWSFNFPVT